MAFKKKLLILQDFLEYVILNKYDEKNYTFLFCFCFDI